MSSEKKSLALLEATLKSRREFLKTSVLGLATPLIGAAAFSALSACSTLDEYVFEDDFDLKDQVLIVGGGISGLYLAYKLRQTRTEYRLLEGSSYLGGRIRSSQGLDFGASVFDRSDIHLQALIKEFSLPTTAISKQQFFIAGGADTLTQALQARIAGLMPYRTLRLKWKLIAIHKSKSKYEAVFETPNGRRTITCRKVALTLPPSQWGSVEGLLNLEDMAWAREWLKTLKPETITKVNLVTASNGNLSTLVNKKPNATVVLEKDMLSLVEKNLKNNSVGLEFSYMTPQTLSETFKIESKNNLEIEKIVDHINSRTKLALTFKKLSAESFFDWSTVNLIQSAYFKNTEIFPTQARRNTQFQIFGDYSAAVKPHTVEGALSEADRVSSIFV